MSHEKTGEDAIPTASPRQANTDTQSATQRPQAVDSAVAAPHDLREDASASVLTGVVVRELAATPAGDDVASPTGATPSAIQPEAPLGLTRVLAVLGLAAPAADSPAVPAAPLPTQWALVAWARRELASLLTLEPQLTTQAVATQAVATQAVATPVESAGLASVTTTSTAKVVSTSIVDSTAYLQAQFDALKPGGTLTLAPATYYHSGNLYVRVANVTINGNGATLAATNTDTSAIGIFADGVTITNLNLTAETGVARTGTTYAAGIVVGQNKGVSLTNMMITGGSSAGVMVFGATNFLIENVTVRDTAADGIQITGGANNGRINSVHTQRTGDDAIAIVSYTGEAICHDIVVNSPVVDGSAQRGLVVTGGNRITFNNIDVSDTGLSGVFIGNQLDSTQSTQSATNITVNGGTISGADYGQPVGALTILSQNPASIVSNVTISGVTIADTPPSAYVNIGHLNYGGGAISNVAYRNIAMSNWYPYMYAIGTNAPKTYTATGFTMNGSAIDPGAHTLYL